MAGAQPASSLNTERSIAMSDDSEYSTTQTPGVITYKTVLGQDFVTSDGVLVDTQLDGQVGVFRNPTKLNAVEALVISSYDGAKQQLFYLSRARSVTGWTMTPVLKDGKIITAKSVAALVNTSGGVDGFYVDAATLKLQHITLRGDAWSRPIEVPNAPVNLGVPRVAYSPGASGTNGTVVVYAGQTKDSQYALGGVFLYAYRHGDGAWSGTCIEPGGWVSSWALALTSEQDWLLTILAAENFGLKNSSPRVTIKQGQGAWMRGTLGRSASTVGAMDRGLSLRSIEYVDAGIGDTTDVALFGLDGPADASLGHALRWVLEPTAAGAATGTLAQTSFAHVDLVRSAAGDMTVYGVSPDMNLFVVRQVAYDRTRMGTSFAGDQTWGPVLQLDTRVARMYPDVSISDTPAIIAADSDTGALHLYVMDARTSLWLAKPITLPTTRQYEISTWQTAVTALDTTGAPLVNYAFELRVDSAADLLVNADYQVVTSTTSAQVSTNALGKLLISSLATSLAPPALVLSGKSVPQQVNCSPAAPVNDYFAGTGSLYDKPKFSAQVVQQIGRNTQLSPAEADSAYTAINQCASMGQTSAFPSTVTAAATHGPRYHVFVRKNGALLHHAATDLHEARGHLGASAATLWSDVWDFAGDVWHAIEKGIHAVEHFIIDAVHKTIQIFVWIGDTLVELAAWVIDTVEAGLQAITAVFNWIKATIEEVIDFLKALFDFKAIWHTKQALASQLLAVPDIIANVVDNLSDRVKGFTDLTEATLHRYFDPLIDHYTANGQKLSSVASFPGIGTPPSADPIAGSVSAADIASDPSMNWMQNKIVTNAPADYAAPTAQNDAIENFFASIVDCWDSLLKIFSDFFASVTHLLDADDLASFCDIALATLLTLVRDTLILIVDILSALVEGILALGELAARGMKALLTQELTIGWGFINDLYGWIAQKAGGQKEPLTLGNLLALMAAFPVTITYKLIAGTGKEPFPGGKYPSPPALTAAGAMAGEDATARTYREVCLTTSGVLAILGGGLIAACDVCGDAPPLLGACSTITTALHSVASMPDWIQYAVEETEKSWPVAICLAAFMGIGVYALAPDVYSTYGKLQTKLNDNQKLKSMDCGFNDVLKVGLSIYGLGYLGYAVYTLVDADYQPPLLSTASLVESLVTPFAAVTIKPLRRLWVGPVPVGRIIQGCKVALDVAGGVGGGSLEISSAWKES